MKKTMVKVAGAFAVAAGILFASCTTDASNLNSQIDTVTYLSAPVVKATAYPGMNYVSWQPVANANGYVVYIYEDDHFIKTTSTSASVSNAYSVLDYVDTDIRDGAKYTYYVEATSKTSTGRSVVTENTMSAPVSVNGIVPAYNTKSLDLVKFENGSKNEKFVVAADNIKVAKDGFDKLSVAFPGKAYLTYAVSYSIDNEKETTNNLRSTLSNIFDRSSNDKTLYSSATLTTAGEYTFYVKASAANDHFGTSDIVTATEKVTVEKLGVSTSASISTAAYKDLGKTVRVVFTPAVLTSGAKAPVSYHKVYRSTAAAPYNYTAVSGTVKATNSTNTTYYVEDSVVDNTVAYIYTVVVTNAGLYDTTAPTKNVGIYTLSPQTATTVTGAASTLESDGVANDITWTITTPSADVKVTGVYTLVKAATDTDTVVAGDFDTTTSVPFTTALDTTQKIYKAYTKNYEAGQKVFMLVTTEQENKAVGEWISAGVTIATPTVSAATFAATKYDNTLVENTAASYVPVLNDVMISVTDTITAATDSIDNYTYEVFKTLSTIKTDISNTTITFSAGKDWESMGKITLSRDNSYDINATSYKYAADLKEKDLADGIYAYKLIKTNKYSKATVSSIQYVVIDTASSIKYTPSISAAWDGTVAADGKRNIKVQFTKYTKADNASCGAAIYEEHDGASKIVGYESAATEPDVKYFVYVSKITKNMTDDVFVLCENANGEITNPNATTSGIYTVNAWDTSTSPASWKTINNYTYTTSFQYTYANTGLTTGASYKYVVVAKKAGCEDKISNIVTVTGAN